MNLILQCEEKMEQVIQNQVISAALQLEKQLDEEIGRLDNMGLDDLDKIREVCPFILSENDGSH